MNIKCLTRGHWWTPDHTYNVSELEKVPGAPVGTDRDVVHTYMTRECRRCGQSDSIALNAEAK